MPKSRRVFVQERVVCVCVCLRTPSHMPECWFRALDRSSSSPAEQERKQLNTYMHSILHYYYYNTLSKHLRLFISLCTQSLAAREFNNPQQYYYYIHTVEPLYYEHGHTIGATLSYSVLIKEGSLFQGKFCALVHVARAIGSILIVQRCLFQRSIIERFSINSM